MFCTNCGTEIPIDAAFCPKCGVPTSQSDASRYPPQTNLDALLKKGSIQEHWIKRFVALVIDTAVVWAVLAFVSLMVWLPFSFTPARVFPPFLPDFSAPFAWFQIPFVFGIMYILYFTVAESMYGKTLGKSVMGLRVVTEEGNQITIEKAFIRNVSKVHGLLLLLDVIIGLGTRGDPKQKYTDRIARTMVQ